MCAAVSIYEKSPILISINNNKKKIYIELFFIIADKHI